MALTQIKTGGLANNSVTDAKVADAITVTGAQTGITQVGTLTSGTWNGTAIASAYLDADTAHLSGTQTFSGSKTFSSTIIVGASNGSEEVKANRTRVRHIDGLADASDYSHGDLYINHISTGDIYMQRDTTFAGNATVTGNLTVNGTGSDVITGDYLYLDAHDNSAAKNLVFRKNDDTWLGQIEFHPTSTAQIVTRVNQPLAFGVNNSQKMTIETDGAIKSTSGMYFTGTALDGINSGIASSGDGGDLRFYISGNQNYTLSGHTLTIDSQGNGSPAQLTCKNNGSSGWTGAAVNLLYEGSSGNRGCGIYMHSTATDKEWYAGTMYAVDTGRYSICYESRASFGEDTAEAAHEVFSVSANGSIAVGAENASGNRNITLNGGTWDEPMISFYPYGNYRFSLRNDGTSSAKKFQLVNNASETIFETGGNNSKDLWFGGDVSAASFTDRTPYPETLQIAYDVLASHKKLDDYDKDDKEHQLDHAKLHDFAKPQITVSEGLPDKEEVKKELSQDGRDASAVISCLVEVVNDLTAKVEALENA